MNDKTARSGSGSIKLGGGDAPTTPASSSDNKTEVTSPGGGAFSGPSGDVESTRRLSSKEMPATNAPEQVEKPDEDVRTRVWRRSNAKPSGKFAELLSSDTMQDPLTGWLVVVSGPGRGRAVTLGYGMNSVGRGGAARVSLDFGDDQISRDSHCTITFDPRGRAWFVSHGQGSNVTYLNDSLVLQPTPLPPNALISIGDTVVRFVPFCSDAFDWPDTEQDT